MGGANPIQVGCEIPEERIRKGPEGGKEDPQEKGTQY